MAVVDQDVVVALAEVYSLEELQSARRDALAAVLKNLPRVEMTSRSFKDQTSAGVFVDSDPKEVVALLNAAIACKEAVAAGSGQANGQMNHVGFSRRPVGW